MNSTTKIKKIFMAFLTLSFAFALTILVSCNQNQTNNSKVYPNTQAENAKISNQYNDICQTISNSAINEFKELKFEQQ